MHRTLSVSSGTNAVGTVKLTALTADQQAWLADVNNQRATVSSPVSFPNLVVDEYAQEQANQWALDEAAGKTAFTDAAYGPYQSNYVANTGALYTAAGVLALVGGAGQYLAADQGWMSEKSNCTNGDWQTCAFSETTGHYINISNTNTAWIGLGESSTTVAMGGVQGDYNLMLIENTNAVGPASHGRVAATSSR